MQYDPIKRSLGKVFNQTPMLRRIFYRLLDWLLLRAWHIKKTMRGIKRQGLKNPVILDAGSGFGQYVYRAASLFPNAIVKGVDVKPEQIADCNRFFQQIGMGSRVKFEEADLTKFCEPEVYDLILSVDVMEHIEEDLLVFRNLFLSLKKDGMLLVSTPSDQGGSDSHHDHEEDGAHGFIDEHVRDGYSIEDIKTKLSKAGFSKVEVAYSYGNPGKLSWKLSMKYPILMLGASKLFFVILPFYYIVTWPLSMILNYFDVKGNHKTGTGLIVKAWK
ncbi:class I SAM-dependent methyltransferase [Prolixibacteraceae bacterium JC049]|nr:class I SAM-dependent methyltransferase [Prolixibacteraceae bacterium JC049]